MQSGFTNGLQNWQKSAHGIYKVACRGFAIFLLQNSMSRILSHCITTIIQRQTTV